VWSWWSNAKGSEMGVCKALFYLKLLIVF
jgi:hypothetical protein